MGGAVVLMFLPIIVIGLLVMALLQMIGGKSIAKLPAANFGSALVICLISGLITGGIYYIIAKGGMIINPFAIIVSNVVVSILSLVIVTSIKWSCSIGKAIGASIINIILNVVFWAVLISKLSDFYPPHY